MVTRRLEPVLAHQLQLGDGCLTGSGDMDFPSRFSDCFSRHYGDHGFYAMGLEAFNLVRT